jgi:hypothetical protein
MAVDMSGLIAYFGHHKCGTQWIKGIARDVSEVIGRTVVIHPGPATVGSDLAASIPDPASTFLCYLNAERRHVNPLEGLRGFHIVRDPRDVIVSAYFSHLHSHSDFGDLARYREQLRSLDKHEGLLLEMERRRNQFDMMRRWDNSRDDILELRMEDLTTDAHRAIPRILSFLGLGDDHRLDERTVAAIVERNEFSIKAGRPPGIEDVTSHYRKGVAGDWVEHFTEAHVAYFKAHYNDLLLKLGYETTADWGVHSGVG